MSENLQQQEKIELNNVKYDTTKYFSENVPQLLLKNYWIYLILAPKNCGKTKYMFGVDAKKQVENDKKFVLIRNNENAALNFGIETYIPNTKIKSNGDIVLNETKKIGIACGVSTFHKLRSRESYKDFSRVYFDEFNENTFKPTDNFYDNFCIALDDIQRENKDLKVFIVGNKHDAEHDFLIRWNITFENDNKIQQQLINDENGPLIQALFLPQHNIPNKTITLGSRLSKFKDTSDAFFHNSQFLSKNNMKVWNYESSIKPNFDIKISNGFCLYDLADQETKYYLILKCECKADKSLVINFIKLKSDYDNLIFNKYKALDIKSRCGDDNVLNADNDDIFDILEKIENYKEQNNLFFDSKATQIRINNLLSTLSLKDI